MLRQYLVLGLIYRLATADVQSNLCSVDSMGPFTTVKCNDVRLTGELPLEKKIPPRTAAISLHISNSSGRIDETTFGNLEGVQNLHLEYCSLSKFALPNLPDLKDLDIRHCFIPQIERNSIKNAKNLKHLTLQTNKMDIVSGSFQDLGSLQFLDIEEQNATLDNQFLKGLKSLILLSITDSTVSTISKDVFRDTPELVDVNLSNNPIESIENGVLDSLKKLKNLNVIETEIDKLDVQLFKENSNLESLRASAKAMKNFDLTKFVKYCPRFYNFDFSLTDCGDANIQKLQKKIEDDNLYVFVYYDGLERPDRC